MWQKVSGFARRHKKKLLFSTLLVGGSYYVWHKWIRKLLPFLKALKELNNAAGGLDFGNAPGAQESREERARAAFDFKQNVADNLAMKQLKSLSDRFVDDGQSDPAVALFKVQDCTTRLNQATKAGDKEEQRARWFDLQVECLARAISSVYALYLFLLLNRVVVNIAGREVAEAAATAEEGGRSDLTALVECTSHVRGAGLVRVAEAVREVVRETLERRGLLPHKKVDREMLVDCLKAVCEEVDERLLADGRGVATLLPEDQRLEPEAAGADSQPSAPSEAPAGAAAEAAAAAEPAAIEHAEAPPEQPRGILSEDDQRARQRQAAEKQQAQRLLEEAQDIVESHHFLGVIKVVVDGGRELLVNNLSELVVVKDKEGVETRPLKESGETVVLAKIFGNIVSASRQVLEAKEDQPNLFVARFTEEPLVAQFCEAVGSSAAAA